LYAALAAFGVHAQKGGKGKDPYQYKAGDKDPDVDPLVPIDKTPPWPSNFGGAAIKNGPAPRDCYPLEVITARGTSEPGPFGTIVGDPVVARCQRDLGKDVCRGYAVQYPATLASFISSQGPDDIAKNIADKAKKCPNMKFIVTGYSQGGGVAASGLTKVVKNGNAGKVIAVIFYAPFGNAAPPKEFNDRKLIHCAQGDPVCLNGADQSKHISYNTKGTPYHENTAKFIVAAWNKAKGNGH